MQYDILLSVGGYVNVSFIYYTAQSYMHSSACTIVNGCGMLIYVFYLVYMNSEPKNRIIIKSDIC